jgi:26S proteasome regulatory subunit N2
LLEVKEAASSSKEKDADKKKDEKETKEAKEPPKEPPKEPAKEPAKEKTDKKAAKDDDKEKKEPEPSFEVVQNPARVLRQQLKVIQLVEGSHYVPVKDIQIGGIVMVKHMQTDAEEELVEPVAGE